MKNHILFIIFFGFVSSSYSQNISTSGNNSAVSASEEIATKFAIPAMPALDFISSKNEEISRPSTLKQLATGLYNGIDASGNIKQGIAIEVAPVSYLSINISPSEYKNNLFKFAFYNTQLSIGTVATSGDNKSTDLGWGIRVTLFDRSDPMRYTDFINNFEEALKLLTPSVPTDTIPIEEYRERIKQIKQDFQKKHWNDAWMTAAYAGGTRLNASQVSSQNNLGYQVSVAGGIPLGFWGQASSLLKLSSQFNGELQKNEREFKAGIKVLAGGPSYNFYAEAGFNPLLNKDNFKEDKLVDTKKSMVWTIGVEFRISDGIWAVAGLGQDANRIVGSNGVQFNSGIRAGIANKSRFKK